MSGGGENPNMGQVGLLPSETLGTFRSQCFPEIGDFPTRSAVAQSAVYTLGTFIIEIAP
jgi:hypothetical protein